MPDSEFPDEDLRWLTYVQKYEHFINKNPGYEPLRRAIYEILYNDWDSGIYHFPLWRTFLRSIKWFILTKKSNAAIKHSDYIVWQDVERNQLNVTIDMLQGLLRNFKRTSILLMKPGLQKTPTNSPFFVYPVVNFSLNSNDKKFIQNVFETFDAVETELLKSRLVKSLLDFRGFQKAFLLVLRKVKPKAVIFTNDQFLSSATFAQIAKSIGVKTFVLQHGAANPFQFPLHAEKILVWGKEDQQYYHGLGVTEDAIQITGSLYHDKFQYQGSPVSPRRRILLISNGNNNDRNGSLPRIAYQWLNELQMESKGQYEFYVRYHPHEKDEFKNMGAIFDLSLNTVPIEQAIGNADVVIGYVSTVLLESALIGRPSIQLLDESAQHLCNYWKKGIAIGVTSYDEFKNTVQKLCSDDILYTKVADQQNSLISEFFANHPHASISVLRALTE